MKYPWVTFSVFSVLNLLARSNTFLLIYSCGWRMLNEAKRLLLVLALSSGAAYAQEAPKNLTLLGIPSATTAPSGLVFGQVSRSVDIASESENRTVLAFGVGFGDANEGLGGQLTVVGAPDSSNFDSFSYFGAKASRRLNSFANPTYLGLSVNRIAGAGEASDLDPSVSLTLTSFRTMTTASDSYPVMFTLGAGSHKRNEQEDAGLLLGAGIGLTPNLGVSGAWSGEQVDLGASIKFGRFENARVSLVLSDAFEQEDRRQLTVGVSWSIGLGQQR